MSAGLMISMSVSAMEIVTAPTNDVITQEDTSVPLQLTLDPGIYNGGNTPDILSTTTGFRPHTAGTTPLITAIPANAVSISIVAFSTEPTDTPPLNDQEQDERNDEYQLLNMQVDLHRDTYSGQVALPHAPTFGNIEQYSWVDVPLGDSALSDPDKVVGFSDIGLTDPTVSVVGTDLHITETHSLETAYHIEFLTSDGASTNFVRTGSGVQFPGDTTSTLGIPGNVLSGSQGPKGIIGLNGRSASGGSHSHEENKGFSRILIDLESETISGNVMVVQGETEDLTVTYAFENYPLVDLRVGGTVSSILDSGATIIGDTTSLPEVQDDPSIYIDANGELVVDRSADFANNYTTMYTAEFYERTGVSSLSSALLVEASNAFFDAAPPDQVGPSGAPINELLFNIPPGATVGRLNLAWQAAAGNGTNENIGLGFVIIDLATSTTSGSLTFMRARDPDLLSWSAVPMGTTIYGATDDDGAPLFEANNVPGSFSDDWVETAQIDLLAESDGTRILRFTASSETSDTNFFDHAGNGMVSWLGTGPLEITGLPLNGTFSHGTEVAPDVWEIDAEDISDLAYIPASQVSGVDSFRLTIPAVGEVDEFTVSIEPVSDPFTFTANDAQTGQNMSVPLVVSATSDDVDGSESFPEYTFSNVPATVTLSSADGTVTDNGGGSWTVDAAALAGLRATGTSALEQLITVDVFNVDVFDIDEDNTIEDGNNGSGVDERDELSGSTTFTLTIVNDTDGDGIPDSTDPDDDNDGIIDTVEGMADTDDDGISDFLDRDSDNDGVPDAIEGSDDSDDDGVPDYLDTDSDNDGILDTDEAMVSGVDTDGDGIDDSYDIDITGGVDADVDGVDDAFEGSDTLDTDGDGIPDAEESDADNDGIPDAIEGNVDTDGDSVPDYLDTDSDNDGILDSVEAMVSGTDTDGDGIDDLYDVDITGGVDADSDGVDDAAEAEGSVDSDGDGIPDNLDLDSDNDGLPDIVEAGGDDADNDGRVDNMVDANNDGLDDGVAALPWNDDDFDGDGVLDRLDLDSDNDGLPDLAEAGGYDLDTDADGRVDMFVDENGDGLDDGFALAPIQIEDLDGDGNPDHLDLDTDDDGIFDVTEAGFVDEDGDGMHDAEVDENGFGFVSSDGSQEHPLIEGLIDSDGNGVADVDEPADIEGSGSPTQASSNGTIITGLAGRGCSVGPVNRVGSVDPTMATLMGLALFMMVWRSIRRKSGMRIRR